ncbi:phosphoenolpyruvate synthase [Synechococcus sp. BS56D]|uniref:phosphoenolpyruvate synthase n=1 Tax=Synechococcus sp. BS56D TaxID=2055944 RepID=UPI001038E744|nr:phosphoenolpyruvate synthase [Synechococcus sp. BS56D]NDD43923.1 phosphoenolpyruvate synthase [Synechococcaceae bacterium WB9_4xB_025]TCD58690.1 phosphoenolpyruvate synthase [Synechococcus sp. BS56D]
MVRSDLLLPLESVDLRCVAAVGGKCASLGEMLQALTSEGIRVPGGFTTTTEAFRLLLDEGRLRDPLRRLLAGLDVSDLKALQAAGTAARALVLQTTLPAALVGAIRDAYRSMGSPPVAVRSSATAEDLPEASFAGLQDTILNVQGEAALLAACRRCYSSLFSDRAIAYRQMHGFDSLGVALAIGIQRMVRSDLGCSGVMFTLDTESGFPDVVLLNAAYGLGESVVQGDVNPDEYWLFKPTLELGYPAILSRRCGSKARRCVLTPEGSVRSESVRPEDQHRFALSQGEVLQLGHWACRIEAHYSQVSGHATPMDLEWAKDGESGELFILQARPETVHSRHYGSVLRRWVLDGDSGEPICRGRAIGSGVSTGKARVLRSPREIQSFQDGELLITTRTDPDWEPILKRASGVITDRGGRTCHAAILARELGLTAIVGTGDGTARIESGEAITASCCEGEEGRVYRGEVPFHVEERDLGNLPVTRTKILMTVSDPEEAFKLASIPCDGVGLARLEFVIANHIRVHPMALLHPERIGDPLERQRIAEIVGDASSPVAYYVDQLAEGMARIAAAFYPRPVLLRFSDFKSNEYGHLIGGSPFEPVEANPMLGWRGAMRYSSEGFREAFALECQALLRVRAQLGLTNVIPMVPFCRSLTEADQVLAEMASHGLVRGREGLQIYVMCELPSNAMCADALAQRFDGFSIGSNDLTQLTLGLDRDSEQMAACFDERDPSVLAMMQLLIRAAKRNGKPVGLCGQAPSDHPSIAEFLVGEGIDSLSLNPDAVLRMRLKVATIEAALGLA